jgi:hypothetical protein
MYGQMQVISFLVLL